MAAACVALSGEALRQADELSMKRYEVAALTATVDRDQGAFDQQRLLAIAAMLAARGYTVRDMEEFFGWPLLPRSADGFLTEEALPSKPSMPWSRACA
jgi:hypothetical protein